MNWAIRRLLFDDKHFVNYSTWQWTFTNSLYQWAWFPHSLLACVFKCQLLTFRKHEKKWNLKISYNHINNCLSSTVICVNHNDLMSFSIPFESRYPNQITIVKITQPSDWMKISFRIELSQIFVELNSIQSNLSTTNQLIKTQLYRRL